MLRSECSDGHDASFGLGAGEPFQLLNNAAGDFKGTSISIKRIAQPDQGNTWTSTDNVAISNNIIRNVSGGFSIQGKQGASTNPIGGLLSRLLIELSRLDKPMFLEELVDRGAVAGKHE